MSRSPKPLAAFFLLAGSLHFVRPRAYAAIMPPQPLLMLWVLRATGR